MPPPEASVVEAVPGYGERAALLVVDVQNDFADPQGSLYVEGGEDVIPFINGQIDRARRAGALIVYSQDWHPESTPHFQKDGGIWPVHCVRETWGAQWHPDLDVDPEAEVIRKGTEGEDGYSVFSVRDPESGAVESTELDRILRDRGIERVVVVGLATDYWVKETGLDAVRRGFHPTVLLDGIRAVNLEPHDAERALDELRQAGVELQ
jgi:nicotinamidase/pyrazinamidase